MKKMINETQIRQDCIAHNITISQLSTFLGKNKNYVANLFSRKFVEEKTIHIIENALFKPVGSYCIDIAVPSCPKEQLPPPVVDIISNIKVLEIEQVLEELQKIEYAIKCNSTWLARLYAVWTNDRDYQLKDNDLDRKDVQEIEEVLEEYVSEE